MGADGKPNRHGLEQEDAVEIDPRRGRSRTRTELNPNERMRRVDMIEVWHRKRVISTDGYNAAENSAMHSSAPNAPLAGPRPSGWTAARNPITPSRSRSRASAATMPSRAACIQTTGIFCRPASCPAQPRQPCRRYKGRAYQAGLEHLRDALDRLASALAKNSGRVFFPCIIGECVYT